jgi:enoyl-CoA hydratase/carnithine racemase
LVITGAGASFSVGGDGLTVRLPLVVGFAKAMGLVITGRRLNAHEARRGRICGGGRRQNPGKDNDAMAGSWSLACRM